MLILQHSKHSSHDGNSQHDRLFDTKRVREGRRPAVKKKCPVARRHTNVSIITKRARCDELSQSQPCVRRARSSRRQAISTCGVSYPRVDDDIVAFSIIMPITVADRVTGVWRLFGPWPGSSHFPVDLGLARTLACLYLCFHETTISDMLQIHDNGE